MDRLGLYKVKRMSRPRANAPYIDVFPVYEDLLGTIGDNYIIDPDYPPMNTFRKDFHANRQVAYI